MDNIIKSANNQSEIVLNKLGVPFRHHGKWLTSCCPVHHGDNTTAFAFNTETNYWKCFTRGCHEEFGANILGLVCGVLQCTKADAENWLIENIDEVEEVVRVERQEKSDQIYAEFILKKLFKTDFYVKRGFKQETVDAFEHGLAQAHKMRNRVVFPIRDENGYIRGFSGRWAGEEKFDEAKGKSICVAPSGKPVPKWKHTKFHKTDYLYNFYRLKNNPSGTVIVVESIGNVMRFWDCGIQNCVATLGAHMSNKQAMMLINYAKRVVLAYDNDKAGLKAFKSARGLLESYVDVVDLFPPVGKDWADLLNEELLEIYGRSNLGFSV